MIYQLHKPLNEMTVIFTVNWKAGRKCYG